jgi:TPR repeat protein
MYAEGVGTAKNLPEAVRLYEKAAEAGEFVAQVERARIYARGVHVLANAEAARKWYAAAAPQKTSVGNCEKLKRPWLTSRDRSEHTHRRAA